MLENLAHCYVHFVLTLFSQAVLKSNTTVKLKNMIFIMKHYALFVVHLTKVINGTIVISGFMIVINFNIIERNLGLLFGFACVCVFFSRKYKFYFGKILYCL